MFGFLQIFVFVNDNFFNWISLHIIINLSTEHIEVRCELAATMHKPTSVHLLHFFPFVSFSVVSKALGQTTAHISILTSSEVDKPGTYCTDTWKLQFHFFILGRCFNLFATKGVLIIFSQHFTLIVTKVCLKYYIIVDLARVPVSEIRLIRIICIPYLWPQKFDSTFVWVTDDVIPQFFVFWPSEIDRRFNRYS